MRKASSAKPLFRAISGRANRPVPDATLPITLHSMAAPPPDGRRAEDFYPTGQPEAIRALFARDGRRIRQAGGVWEPAAGDGALAREIEAMGMRCTASDLIDRGSPKTTIRSFYDFEHSPEAAIITNPPYSEINAGSGHGRWLRHTLELPEWRYCALLLSWDWPAGRINGLGAMLEQHPFAYCYLMRWKIDFTGEGRPAQRNAWFVWDRDDHRSEPAFRWLDRSDGRQPDLF